MTNTTEQRRIMHSIFHGSCPACLMNTIQSAGASRSLSGVESTSSTDYASPRSKFGDHRTHCLGTSSVLNRTLHTGYCKQNAENSLIQLIFQRLLTFILQFFCLSDITIAVRSVVPHGFDIHSAIINKSISNRTRLLFNKAHTAACIRYATDWQKMTAQSQCLTGSSTVAVIADRTAYDVRTVYWQTVIKGVSVTSLRTVGTGTHDPIQRVQFMNASKLYLFKRDNGA